jgi:predicted RNA-binding protein with PIN domain
MEQVEPASMNKPTYSALLLVDGYNIIGSWTSLKLTRDRDGLETARQELVERLLNYTTHQGYKTQIVFDSQHQNTASTEELYGPFLSVYFTAWTQTADTYIEKFCAAFSRKQNRASPRLIVATSDRDQQLTVVGYGAECMSAQLLAQNVEQSIQDLKRQQRSRSTQSSRFLFPPLDSKAQEKLAQWWQGG